MCLHSAIPARRRTALTVGHPFFTLLTCGCDMRGWCGLRAHLRPRGESTPPKTCGDHRRGAHACRADGERPRSRLRRSVYGKTAGVRTPLMARAAARRRALARARIRVRKELREKPGRG